jgi:hypothetical protein
MARWRHQSYDLRDGTRVGSSHTGDATWCHNGQNDMLVAYRALSDSFDLTMDVIFMLCVVVGLRSRSAVLMSRLKNTVG